MRGAYTKRKLNNVKKWILERLYYIRRSWNRMRIKERDFTIISNNCWAGKMYQYLDMPYLSPTVGLYFFAEDYIKFVSNLKYYLSLELRFISVADSRYREVLQERKHDMVPIAVLDDVEVVFLHYHSEEEAKDKWDRRKRRVNYENMFLKFSKMNLCTDKEMKEFDELPFKNKFMFNNCKMRKYACEIYWNGKSNDKEILLDTVPFPGNVSLTKIFRVKKEAYFR